MNGDTEQQNRTLVSLREYIERRLDDHCVLNESRFLALENATRKASEIMDLRLASMNEFRDALRDQTRTYVTCERVDRIEERLKSIEWRASNLDGRLGAYAAGLIVLLTIISIVLKFLPVG